MNMTTKDIKLTEHISIGLDQNVLVIPEVGINHNGSLDVAKEMVLSAHRAGARVIKHQTHIVADEMCEAAKIGRASCRERV